MTAPATYPDLVEVAKEIRRAKKIPLLWGLKDLNGANTSLQVIIPQVVGTSAIIAASEAKNYDQSKFVAVFDLYRKMLGDGILDASDTGTTVPDAQELLGKGKSVMYPAGSQNLPNIVALKAGIDVFKSPVQLVDSPVTPYWGGIGQCYTIPTANKYADETAMFLLWWFDPAQLTVQVEKSALVSSEPEANKAITDPLARMIADNLGKVQDDGLFWAGYIPSAESTAWEKTLQSVVSKQLQPEGAMKTIQAALK